MRRTLVTLVAAIVLLAGCAQMRSAPDKAVYFVEPKDGATVTSPFWVVFGVKGMAVEAVDEQAKKAEKSSRRAA